MRLFSMAGCPDQLGRGQLLEVLYKFEVDIDHKLDGRFVKLSLDGFHYVCILREKVPPHVVESICRNLCIEPQDFIKQLKKSD